MSQHDPTPPPVLRIVRGNPDDTDIAALVTALTALTSSNPTTPPAPQPLSVWADRNTALRHPAGQRPLRPGPHAWRASTLPG